MNYPTQPIQVLNQGTKTDAPNFRRILDAKSCYFCRFNECIGYGTFKCIKFGIDFGESVPLQVEFSCDAWESG